MTALAHPHALDVPVLTLRDRTGERLRVYDYEDGAPIVEAIPRGADFGVSFEVQPGDLNKLIKALRAARAPRVVAAQTETAK